MVDALELPNVSTVAARRARGLRPPSCSAVKADRSPVEYMLDGDAGLPLYVLAHAARAGGGHLPRRRPDVLLRPGAAVRGDGRRSVLITPHRFCAGARAPRDQRHLQRPVPDLPPRRARARGAELVARPLHRVVLLPLRGRQARRPEVPRRLARALRGRPRLAAQGLRASRRGTSPSIDVRETPQGVYVDDDPLIFFHYHRVRCSRAATSGGRPATTSRRRTGELVYDPYLDELARAVERCGGWIRASRAGIEPAPTAARASEAVRQPLGRWFLWKTPWLMRFRHRRWRHTGEPSAETA